MNALARSLAHAWNVLREQGVRGFGSKLAQKVRHMQRVSTFKPYVRTLRPAGVPIKVPIVDLFSEDWYGDWLDTSAELRWIRGALAPGDVVADCGANVGFTSAFFACCVGPTGRIHAFEPLPRNAAAATRSAELNGLDNVVVVNAAVGSAAGQARLSTGFGNAVVDAHGAGITVQVVTLDEYFAQRPPDFLKIDVEGYELQVLRGAVRVLARRPKLAIELHCASYPNGADDVRTILALLDRTDYEAHVQLEVEGTLEPFDARVHTAERIASCANVHWFATPRTPSR